MKFRLPGKHTKVALFVLWILLAVSSMAAAEVKYVFFFLGDGLSNSQIQTTEAAMATAYAKSTNQPLGPEAGDLNANYLLNPAARLRFTQFPIMGMQTTYDAYSLNTDSASAGTAFAAGIKTKSGMINMSPDQKEQYKSVAQLAHERGMKVGILTSVSIDHATPASYYASVPSRSYFNSIGTQLANSGYEFFGGGGFVSPQKAEKSGDTNNDVYALLAQNGYTVLNDRASILNLKTNPKSKVVAINPWLQDSAALPYHIDKVYYDNGNMNLTLSEMTEVAIANLEALDRTDGGKGFFIMVEGGKIDWACHANDAMAAMVDVIDFDAAVGQAIDFYNRHPKETLIIVTGDHETGGMSVGHATTAYKAYYDKMFGQKASFQYFTDNQWQSHKTKYATGYDYTRPDNLASNADMLVLLKEVFGLDYSSLNDYQKQRLEDAYDKSMAGKNSNNDAANKLLYGGYEAITVTITHILNEIGGIGWTSYSHTGQPVPLFAIGQKADTFVGFYDNTDIAKKLASVMNISQTLPVVK
uniref:Alkaline phosphatase n=1 Tax=Desulfatirhabdium butyrativorans TaxID=340467 RepID=A0A7C4RLQ9_9BACT